ncbi:MAG: hypothetical protein HYY18_13700 [Planctomycetes bacterium]|nr:hypothetical protein [Planctomycetota bacterium]
MQELIDRFYAAFERDPDRLRIPRAQDFPSAMLGDAPVTPPWTSWKLIPGGVSLPAFRQWEDAHGVRLPDSFRTWFLARHTLSLDCGLLRLAVSPSNKPFADLEELLEWEVPMIRTRQLFPIGDEGLRDAGPLCLDLRERHPEPPVVFWDADEEQVSPVVFSGFAKLLEGAAFAMEHDLAIFDDPALMDAFLALDPGGAGGPGAAYWRGEDVLDD